MTKTSDYYYDLPQELIAQTPLERRDSSRLMVLNRRTGEIRMAFLPTFLTICTRETCWRSITAGLCHPA